MKVLSWTLCYTAAAATVFLLLTHNTNPAFAQSCTDGAVRLVGGYSSNEGRLEVCMNGMWGTVCDDGWGLSEAKVACRQLDYPVDEPGIEEDISFKCCAQFGRGSGSIFLDDLKCTGEESSLVDCSHTESTDCGHSEDVGVICPSLCPESSIRLTNGLTHHEGIVEVCLGGVWRGVCDTQWDYEDAFVACRELGYPATGALPYGGSIIGSHLRPNVTRLQCLGNESKLTDCKYSITASCGVSDTAAVYCIGEIVADGNCSEGALRLAGGNTENEGRVEVCSNGIWGTICNTNNWDSREATVVCKQLGYTNPRVHVFTHTADSYFGKGTGVILLDSVSCEGTELTIQACASSSHDPHRCSHDTDVGVRCEEFDDSANCTDGDVQLSGSESITEGLVEICVANTWRSICNDGWGEQEAAVVCKQLGFQSANSSTYTAVLSVESAGPYYLDDVDCAGDEMNLIECSHNGIGVHNCATGKHARVRCDASECRHSEIRLAGGATMHEGRLEVCSNGHWGTVCDDSFSFAEASVVCRQLFGPSYKSVHFCCGNYFGRGSGGLIINDLRCRGSETRLLDCQFTNVTDFHDARCSHDEDVVIRCYNNSGCTHGEVRLVDGRTAMEGRVEMCSNGVWGAISDKEWDYKAATVICRQLQFPSEWSIPLTSSYFGRGAAPIVALSMLCYGDESSIIDCLHTPISPETLFFWHYSVAGVMCQGNTTSTQECTSGTGRLVGGAAENEGRVELCVDGFWATACDDEWDQEDAIVLCRQIGLEASGATLLPGGSFGEGRGPIIGFDCSSRESNLLDCELTFGPLNCHHGQDAGVKCQAPHGYAVTVTTVPPQGPFIIGSTVMLHCTANIMPSECVTYTWESSIRNPQLTSTTETSPNATISITAGHPKVGHYFCHIHSCSSSAVLGIGSTSVEVQGYIYPIGGELLQYEPPEKVTLGVAISTEKVRHHFRDLRWYHNGVEIIPSGRVYFSDGNTTLTINNSTETDSGTYEVKFTGLVVRPYRRSCEVAVLNLLREYPVLMPVVFYLQSGITDETVRTSIEQSTVIKFVGSADFDSVPFSDLDEITLDVNGKTDVSVDGTASTSWYHNGGELPLGSELGALKKPLQHISQSLEIKKSNQIVDSGVYEVDVNVDAYSHLVTHLQCPNAYAELVHNIFLTDRITLDQDVVQLKYYEPPVVVLETDKEAIGDGEIATLTCSAHGGYPPVETVSFTKDGNFIAVSSTRRSLTVTTESVLGTPYGLYSCIVDNSVDIEQQTVLIKEKGNILAQARFEDSGNCKEWNEFTLHQSVMEVKEILLPVIKEECNCNFSISNFQDSTITCAQLGEVLMFDIIVEYSTEEGDITATFINELVQNWLINRGKSTILISGETVQLSSPLCDLNSSPAHQHDEASAYIITGVFCGGLVAGILLISIPTIIFCAHLRKKYHGFKVYDTVDGKAGENELEKCS